MTNGEQIFESRESRTKPQRASVIDNDAAAVPETWTPGVKD